MFFDNPVPSIVYIPTSFEILEANESALALYGYSPEQIRSRKLMDLFASESHRNHPELSTELRKPVNAIGPFAHRGASGQELIVSMVFFQLQCELRGRADLDDPRRNRAPHGGRSIACRTKNVTASYLRTRTT